MAIKCNIDKHAFCFPSKVLAREGGAHIYNVKLTKDHDNGNIIGRGDWLSLDLYEEAAPTGDLKFVVREQAANGNWYLEVTECCATDLLICQAPIIEEEYNMAHKNLKNFYNAKGDRVRCYQLCIGDIIEVSVEAITEESVEGIEAGAEVSVVTASGMLEIVQS